jgi:hypothetical protein
MRVRTVSSFFKIWCSCLFFKYSHEFSDSVKVSLLAERPPAFQERLGSFLMLIGFVYFDL